MAKVIIGIHGLGNKPPKRILERWWISSIREGLRRIGHDRAFIDFRLVYWAGYLHTRPLDPLVSDPADPLYLDERYIPSTGASPPVASEKRRKLLDFIEKELDKLLLNDDLSLNFSGITDILIKRWFGDLNTYYRTECNDENNMSCPAKRLINTYAARIIESLKGHDIMLVGHSMGSIIAYDTLVGMTGGPSIDTFVTAGSPLGLPVVMSKVAAERPLSIITTGSKLTTPQQVTRRWCNLSDLNDKIAFNYNLADDYDPNRAGVAPEDFTVINDYEMNGVTNPHKIYGYLRTPAFAEIVHDFLAHGRHPLTNTVSGTVQRFLAKLF